MIFRFLFGGIWTRSLEGSWSTLLVHLTCFMYHPATLCFCGEPRAPNLRMATDRDILETRNAKTRQAKSRKFGSGWGGCGWCFDVVGLSLSIKDIKPHIATHSNPWILVHLVSGCWKVVNVNKQHPELAQSMGELSRFPETNKSYTRNLKPGDERRWVFVFLENYNLVQILFLLRVRKGMYSKICWRSLAPLFNL